MARGTDAARRGHQDGEGNGCDVGREVSGKPASVKTQ
jgi:hypothetical protein